MRTKRGRFVGQGRKVMVVEYNKLGLRSKI